MTIAITGATGFIGGGLTAALAGAGREVVALGRRPVHGIPTRTFALGADVEPGLLDGVDTLVHSAWDLESKRIGETYARNVVGSAKLLTAANAAGVRRIVFISSMSAYAGTGQVYGRTKLETEHLVNDLGGVSLRLGLVWGTKPGGMAGAVQKLAVLPLVPVFGMHSYQFAVHEDDAGSAIQAAMDRPDLTGVLGVADPTPVPTPRLIRGLAGLAGSRAGRLVPIPWQPVYWSMRLAEMARIPLPLRSDSVLGLVRPAPDLPGADTWAGIGLRFRSFPAPQPDVS